MSRSLTDEQKLTAELFDDKFLRPGFSALFASQAEGLSHKELVHYDFLVDVAVDDAGIAVWDEKIRYDAVRPLTAIRVLSGDECYRGYGPPREDVDAAGWTTYMPSADHPEYPSGSAAFCAARRGQPAVPRHRRLRLIGVEHPAGSSRVQPGVVPVCRLTWTATSEETRE